jgi:signal transduction histidine kinase
VRNVTPLLRRLAGAGWTVPVVSLSLAAALVAVGWFDYTTTRREFMQLLEAHAASVRETVGAAARANLAAAEEMQAQITARLLDNARLLAELDRLDALSERTVTDIAARNQLFRVTLFEKDGSRRLSLGGIAQGGPGTGRGQGGPGWGQGGPGWGQGPGALGGPLVDRLIKGGEAEAVTEVHEGRREGIARLSAGVRRAGGGAIVLYVDASEVADLRRQTTLDHLLDDIVRSTSDVAYVVFESAGVRRASGTLPPSSSEPAPQPGDVPGVAAPSRPADDSVLEISGSVDLAGSVQGQVRLGMRLDGLRTAERRTLSRLAVSLGAAVALGVLAVGLIWLRQQYGSLSLEHARAQEALRRRDRLAAMGELASSVAHEIRNPLNAIGMSAQRLKMECLSTDAGADAESIALVDVIQQESQRINRTVQQFLEFARPPALQPRPTPLAPWLESIATAARSLAESRGLTLHHDAAALGDAIIDPDQLRQALDNLLRNAIDATPAGGHVILRGSAAARTIVFEVEDSGDGIPPDVLPKIFDLYFTTKGDGTGIGLPVTQQIVTAHGGRIDVTSVPGRGTTMRVTLPSTPEVTHG